MGLYQNLFARQGIAKRKNLRNLSNAETHAKVNTLIFCKTLNPEAKILKKWLYFDV